MLRTMRSEYDRLLLAQEIARLKAQGYSFQGETIEAQLGADRWVLGVGVVDDRRTQKRVKGFDHDKDQRRKP